MKLLIRVILLIILLSLFVPSVHALDDLRIDYSSIPDDFKPLAECLVPCDQIVDGGPGKDGIPSIDNPQFDTASIAEVDDNELVAGIVVDGQAYAFPYNIMNWHEIANLQINGKLSTLTYCPLTGSTIHYSRLAVNNSEFGVSGKLYENNLVMYDRITDSYFSQMGRIGITGENIGLQLDQIVSIETKWSTWVQMYPDTLVLNENTGYNRNYDRYPYGSYEVDRSIFFPTSYDDGTEPYNLFHPKEKTLVAYIDNTTVLATFEATAKVGGVVNFEVNGKNYVIISDSDLRIMRLFRAGTSDGEEIQIVSRLNTVGLPLFIDNLGNSWNLKGESTSGPNRGETLTAIEDQYLAFWFAAIVFNPNAVIYLPQESATAIPTEGVTDDFVSISNDPIINASSVYQGNVPGVGVSAPVLPAVVGLGVVAIIMVRRRR